MGFFWTIVVLLVMLGLAWRYLGAYMAAVFEGRVHFLGFIERPIYRLLGTSPDKEQSWKRYAGSIVVFSGVFLGVGYLLLRLQGSLPLNPQHLGAVPPALSWNTATSFVTNTNWQNYGGETTMSYFSQIGVLTVQQFVSAAVGIAVAHRRHPGLLHAGTRRPSATSGSTSPAACSTSCSRSPSWRASIFVGQGAVQTLAGPVSIHNALNGVTQTIAARTGRLHGGRSCSWAPTAAASSTSTWPIPSRTRPGSPTSLHLALSLHPVRVDLHLRQDGGEHPPGRGPADRHGHHFRRLGRLHRLRRAPGQPGRRGRRRASTTTGQHRGQGSPLRRHDQRALQRVDDPDLRRPVDSATDSFTPIGGFGPSPA